MREPLVLVVAHRARARAVQLARRRRRDLRRGVGPHRLRQQPGDPPADVPRRRLLLASRCCPSPWEEISHLNPIFYLVQAVRYGFLGTSDVPVGLALLVTARARGGLRRLVDLAVRHRPQDQAVVRARPAAGARPRGDRVGPVRRGVRRDGLRRGRRRRASRCCGSAFAAVVLMVAIWRPQPARVQRGDLRLAALFGLVLGVMNSRSTRRSTASRSASR